MKHQRAWLGGALSLVVAVAVVWSCARGAPKEAASPAPGTAAVDGPDTPSHEKLAESTEGTSSASAKAPGTPANGVVAPSGSPSGLALTGSATPEGSSAGPGARIAQAVATSDPRDLAFLSHIERELKRDPPPEVHALIRRRQQGASRDELVAGARALADLPLRVLALRWVDSVLPGPDAAAPAVAPQPKPSGHSPVAPITPVR